MADRFIDMMNELALPVIDQNDCDLVDSEFVKEGEQRILRFYIEKKQGKISLDELAEVSRQISSLIDEIETAQEEFVLELSSPGVNRVLKTEKDFIKFKGSLVDVSLYKPIDGIKKFTAKLEDYCDGVFTFNIEEKTVKIAQKEVGKINLYFDFSF